VNKPLKTTILSLISVAGLVAVAAAVAAWLVFTPSRLTPIANSLLRDYFTCETKVGEVDITVFSTFPQVGMRLRNVLLLNPRPGAPSDTLAALEECVAIVDAKAFLDDRRVVVKRFKIKDGQVSLYAAHDGISNFDIVRNRESEKNTESEPIAEMLLDGIELQDLRLEFRNDSSGMIVKGYNLNTGVQLNTKGSIWRSSSLTLNLDSLYYTRDGQSIRIAAPALEVWDFRIESDSLKNYAIPASLDGIRKLETGLKARFASLSFTDMQNGDLCAELGQTVLDVSSLSIDSLAAVSAQLKAEDVYVGKGQKAYVEHYPFSLNLGFESNLAFDTIRLRNTDLAYAGERLNVDAVIELADSVHRHANLSFSLDETRLESLWELVPRYVRNDIKDMRFIGTLNLKGRADVSLNGNKVTYNALDVKSDIRDVDVRVGEKLHFAAIRDQVHSVYPHGTARNPRIRTDIMSENLTFDMKDSTSVTASIHDMDATLYVTDHVLYGSSNIPFVAAQLKASALEATVDDTIHASASNVDSNVAISEANHRLGEKQRYKIRFTGDGFKASMGNEAGADLEKATINADATYDPKQSDVLLKWSPRLGIDFQGGILSTRQIPAPLEVTRLKFDFNLDETEIQESSLRLGNSDFSLRGKVCHLGDWLQRKDTLRGDLTFQSVYADVYQLMDYVNAHSGAEQVASEPSQASPGETPDTAGQDTASDPFIVPRDMQVTLNTKVAEAKVGDNTFQNVAGKITMYDGNLVLEQVGFSHKAAEMQITAMYNSNMRNHLFVGGTFHLLNVDVAELIKLVPQVDTIVPMLKSFEGKAEFHLAAETNLRADYSLKMSTLKATAAVEGQNLTLLDNQTFSTMAKYLMFSKKTRNQIDTLSVEMAVARKKATIYPMLLVMDKYKAIVSGTHSIDGEMPFSYHVSIVDTPLPVRLGLDIKGEIEQPDNISFSLAKCKYAYLYRPEKRNLTQTQALEFKELISKSLKRNVRQ
jgi:hypothetical protein